MRDYDARLAYLDSETERLRTELATLSESIRATPVNEIQLSALERRYENIQGQYNTAVARLASAATGERIEVLSKGERFSVVEQAVPPTSPDRPNRLLIAAASVVAGIGAGLGLVLLLELLNGAIRRPEDLARKLEIQAFGAVPYIRTRREVLVKRAVIGSAVVTAVVILPGRHLRGARLLHAARPSADAGGRTNRHGRRAGQTLRLGTSRGRNGQGSGSD